MQYKIEAKLLDCPEIEEKDSKENTQVNITPASTKERLEELYYDELNKSELQLKEVIQDEFKTFKLKLAQKFVKCLGPEVFKQALQPEIESNLIP